MLRVYCFPILAVSSEFWKAISTAVQNTAPSSGDIHDAFSQLIPTLSSRDNSCKTVLDGIQADQRKPLSTDQPAKVVQNFGSRATRDTAIACECARRVCVGDGDLDCSLLGWLLLVCPDRVGAVALGGDELADGEDTGLRPWLRDRSVLGLTRARAGWYFVDSSRGHDGRASDLFMLVWIAKEALDAH